MSQVTGPIAVTASSTGALAPPGPGATYFDRVVLANVSPFLALLTIGADQDWLQSSEVNVFNVPPAGALSYAMSASPNGPAVAQTASYLTGTWYMPNEELLGTYPTSLPALFTSPPVGPPSASTAHTVLSNPATAIHAGVGTRTAITVFNPTANAAAVFLGWKSSIDNTNGYRLEPGYGVTFCAQGQLYGYSVPDQTVSWEDE